MELTIGELKKIIKREFSKQIVKENLASQMGIMNADEYEAAIEEGDNFNEQIMSADDYKKAKQDSQAKKEEEAKMHAEEILKKCLELLGEKQAESIKNEYNPYFTISVEEIKNIIKNYHSQLDQSLRSRVPTSAEWYGERIVNQLGELGYNYNRDQKDGGTFLFSV